MCGIYQESHLKITLSPLERSTRNQLGKEFVSRNAVCDDLLLTSTLVLWKSS